MSEHAKTTERTIKENQRNVTEFKEFNGIIWKQMKEDFEKHQENYIQSKKKYEIYQAKIRKEEYYSYEKSARTTRKK